MSKFSIKRTTITVPIGLVEDLQKAVSASSKTEAVVIAIHEEIRRQKLKRFRSLAGKIKLTPSILKGRHHDDRLR